MSGKNSYDDEKKEQAQRKKPKRRIQRPFVKKRQMKIQPEINDLEFQWDENEDFVVQKIIGEENWNNQKYYLVKWKGFDIALSTWQASDKVKHMTDLIEDYERSNKGKKDRTIREETNVMMNPYRATQIHGHFLYGDQPSQIVNTFVQFDSEGRKTIYLQVSWKHRETEEGEICLENSILDSDLVFDHNPQFLLDFYQKSIRLHPQPNQP